LSYSKNQTQKKILAQWIAWWMSKDQDYTEMLKIMASSTMSGTRKAMLQLTRKKFPCGLHSVASCSAI
jgi:hypothetical protein